MLVTIFTPTYNRAYILPQLYKSLVEQTDKSFEWLLVDDGSVDNTDELIAEWIKENKIPIRYIKTANGGKHRAINVGVQQAKGELFFIVDSDDFLTLDAVEKICKIWQSIDNRLFTGVLLRKFINSNVLGSPFHSYSFQATTLEMTYKYGQRQDRAEIFVTEKLKEFPFPEIEGEKFVPESYVWDRLTFNRPLWCVNEAIYCCEYLPDGYSFNFKRNLKQNPKGFALFYKTRLRYKIVPLKDKLKAVIRLAQCLVYKLLKSYIMTKFLTRVYFQVRLLLKHGMGSYIKGLRKRQKYKNLQKEFAFNAWHVSPLELREYAMDTVSLLNRYARRERWSRVVEIGCGIGEILRKVDVKYKYGYDLDGDAIKIATRLSEKESYHVGSFDDVDMKEPVDCLVTVNWMHALPEEYLKKVYADFLTANEVPYVMVDSVKNTHCHDWDKILPAVYKKEKIMGPYLSERYIILYKKHV